MSGARQHLPFGDRSWGFAVPGQPVWILVRRAVVPERDGAVERGSGLAVVAVAGQCLGLVQVEVRPGVGRQRAWSVVDGGCDEVDAAVSERGDYYAAKEARTIPGRVQRPRLPFGVAATGPRGMALAARYGQAWVTTGDPALYDEGTPAQSRAAIRV